MRWMEKTYAIRSQIFYKKELNDATDKLNPHDKKDNNYKKIPNLPDNIETNRRLIEDYEEIIADYQGAIKRLESKPEYDIITTIEKLEDALNSIDPQNKTIKKSQKKPQKNIKVKNIRYLPHQKRQSQQLKK